MEQNQDFGIEVDEEGRLIVPPSLFFTFRILLAAIPCIT